MYSLFAAEVVKPGDLVQHCFGRSTTKLPRHCALVIDLHTTKPAHFFLSISFRSFSSFESTDLPAYCIPCTETFSFGLEGLALPHTRSTRLSLTAFNSFAPFFLIISDSFRASAKAEGSAPRLTSQGVIKVGAQAAMTFGSTPTTLPPSD